YHSRSQCVWGTIPTSFGTLTCDDASVTVGSSHFSPRAANVSDTDVGPVFVALVHLVVAHDQYRNGRATHQLLGHRSEEDAAKLVMTGSAPPEQPRLALGRVSHQLVHRVSRHRVEGPRHR